MKVEACCKINIGLHVIRRREDGYHDISTLMYPVKGLCDTLQVDASSDDSFSCKGIEVDCPPQDNLCIRAYRLLKDEFGTGSAAIRLGKRIPFGAGLGGGSSDAAAVLCAMNRIYGLGLDSEALERRAALLGSDTSFFVRSVPRICSGRGEIMTDCPIDLSGLYILLVKPPYGVSTRQAYSGIVPSIPSRPLEELLTESIDTWKDSLCNDFEKTVFAIYPELMQIKRRMYETGAVYASMSGSGSAIYGLFREKPTADFGSGMFSFAARL